MAVQLARCPVCGWQAKVPPLLPEAVSLWLQERQWVAHVRGVRHLIAREQVTR